MRNNWTIILPLTLFATVVLFVNLKPVFHPANSMRYSKERDAQKSYFNFAYFLKFADRIKQDGINYSYAPQRLYGLWLTVNQRET